MSAPAAWAIAQKVAQKGNPTGVESVKSVTQKNGISSGELFSINSLFAGVIQSFPVNINRQAKNCICTASGHKTHELVFSHTQTMVNHI